MVEWRLRVERLRRCDRVFFSPHPGDVSYACPAALLKGYYDDKRSLVVSVFTETGVRSLPAAVIQDTHLRSQLALMHQAEARYERRRNNEIEAARRGRFAPFLAGLVDAPFRQWDGRYSDILGLLWEPSEGDTQTLDEVMALMAAVIQVCRPKEVYVPLGVGRHVDHRLIHHCARTLDGQLTKKRERPTFWCYEDRPYALVEQATAMRLRELGYPVEHDADTFLQSLWESAYVSSLGASLQRRSPLSGRYLESVSRPPLTSSLPESRVLSYDNPDELWRVVSAYDTQALTFGDRRQFRREARLQARRRQSEAPYVEQQWRLPTLPIQASEGLRPSAHTRLR